MDLPYDKEAYEQRYAKVYEAGAQFWEDPKPTEELAAFIQETSFPKGLDVIELGCGEGRDAVFLAEQGHRVTAIDVAPSAINRAIEWAAKEGVHIDFQVGDIVDLRSLADSSYDLAVNVGCLHMIVNEDAMLRHLREAFRILRPKGIYFSCNIGSDKPFRISDLSQAMPRPGSLTPRKIKVDGVEREIMLQSSPLGLNLGSSIGRSLRMQGTGC